MAREDTTKFFYPETPSINKTVLLILLFFLVPSVSCHMFHRTLTNREYGPKGYSINSPFADYTYQKSPFKRTMIVGDGYQKRTYIEIDGDSKVDQVKFKGETYSRSEENDGKVFQKADREWKEYMESLEVKEVHKTWLEMSREDRLRRARYFNE